MLKKALWASSALMMVLATASAEAGVGVGAKAGTLGFGAELTKSLSEHFNARLGINKYTYSSSTTSDGINYNTELELKSGAALLDWHPFAGSFRLTAGYILNNNQLNMTSVPSGGSYTIGNQTYSSSQVGRLKGTVDFGNGPYLGLGFGNAGDGKGLGFSFELGVLSQGSPSLSLTTEGTDPTLANNATFKQNLEAERVSAEKDMEDFKYYPVVSLGLSYSF